jgi:hypothetical protein
MKRLKKQKMENEERVEENPSELLGMDFNRFKGTICAFSYFLLVVLDPM